MLKKLSALIFVTLFLLGSITIFAAASEQKEATTAGSLRDLGKLNLFDERDDMGIGDGPGTLYMGPQLPNQPVAPVRQVCADAITWRDYQHNSTIGRQCVYPSYYDTTASNKYVYMIYTKTHRPAGTSDFHDVIYAVYDWTANDWNFDCCAVAVNSSLNPNARYCNLDAIPDSSTSGAFAVPVFHYSADAQSPVWTYWGYANEICETQFFVDSLPGPPCSPDVQTGFCGDENAQETPYIWPKVSVQNKPGVPAGDSLVIHVASNEAQCEAAPDDAIETSSIVYYRGLAEVSDPTAVTWSAPEFIDSVYSICQHVVAEDFGPNVYYVYLKPLYYYYSDDPHPCEANGLGHYQQSCDVVYRKSTDYGDNWGALVNITDYNAGGAFENNLTEPANSDITCLVDPRNVLHIVWGSANRDPENNCASFYAMKMWHWDSQNNCISIAYDAAHPRFFAGNLSAWDHPVTQQNISWCDSTLYITFVRFGAHPVGDTSLEIGSGDPGGQDTLFQVADIMVVASDISGSLGKTWTQAVNLTDTDGTDCFENCDHEVYPFMAPLMRDSLMIEYIHDLEPGAWMVDEGNRTDNPVMFMTWPCFSMSDVGTSCDYTTIPDPTEWEEVALAPNGVTTGCTTPATYTDSVILSNAGNVDVDYTTSSSDDTWLDVTGGAAGTASAGAGPKGLTNGCAAPAIIKWTANSTTLPAGNYRDSITVNITTGGCDDFYIIVNAVVACEYFEPEWANIQGGCWGVDVWNVPQAGHQDQRDFAGNMIFFGVCGGDLTVHPLYNNALIVGWNDGAKAFSMMMGDEEEDNYNAQMRALDSIVVTEVGNPSGGQGYYKASGKWCTEDSLIHGEVEYYVPGNQDTSCLIEKFTIWNESGAAISDFLVGEGTDWDVREDSNYDDCGFDPAHLMLYQTGCRGNTDVFAGVAPHCGYDQMIGGATLDNHDFIYPHVGYNPDSIYDKLNSLDGTFELFKDSCTDLNMAYRFWEGELGTDDTLTVCKIKAVSANSYAELQEYIDKAYIFIVDWNLCCQPPVYDGINKDNQDDYVPTDGDPTGTVWHELYPVYCDTYTVLEWADNGDGILSYCDTLISVSNDAIDTIKEHVKRVTTTIEVTLGPTTYFFDYLSYNPYNSDLDINHVVNSWWHEVYPSYSTTGIQCDAYTDVDANDVISAPDVITLGGVAYTVSSFGVRTDIITEIVVSCQGVCGNANNQGGVNVADAVWIINFVFAGGDPPQPVLACGNANGQGGVNVADAVWIINFVFAGGDPPGDCDPGNPLWTDGDCCPFTP